MFTFTCPVCSRPLAGEGGCLKCAAGHSYDIARGGWVNLLIQRQSGSKRHGDDAMMVRARSEFLGAGHYSPLLEQMWAMLEERVVQDMHILDAGCGEGWYLRGLLEKLAEAGLTAQALGIDISRDAVKAAARSCPDGSFAVAGVTALPVENSSCDLLLSLFAPVCMPEFARVLRRGGLLLRVHPLERHLYALKEAVYDRPVENPPEHFLPEGFRLADSAEVRFDMQLESSAEIRALFAMTPYYYKTSASDQSKLDRLERLTVQAEFGVSLYEKE